MLKYLSIFACFFVVAQLSSIQPRDSRNWMEDNIYEILDAMKHRADPWIVDDYEHTIADPDGGKNVTYGYSDVSFTGVSKFDIKNVEFDMDKWAGNVEIIFPDFIAKYRVYTNRFIIFGEEPKVDATINAKITDFNYRIGFNIYNNTDNTGFKIKDARVTVRIGTIDYKLTGVFGKIDFESNEAKWISDWVNNNFANDLDINEDIYTDLFSFFTQYIIDIYL